MTKWEIHITTNLNIICIWIIDIKTVEQLFEDYKEDRNFNYRDTLQLHELLNNQWRHQELKSMMIDYKRAQYRSRVNFNAYIRREKQLAKIEAKIQRMAKHKEKLSIKRITNCSKKLLMEYNKFICDNFSNPYRLFKRPIFFFVHLNFKKYKDEFGVIIKWICEFLGVSERGHCKWIDDGMKIHRDTGLALKTIKKVNNKFGLENSIVYSDRAKSYNSIEYINYCKEKNIVQSMNDRPISTQNLPIEKFFDIFKNEFLKKIDVALGTKIHLKKKSIYL